MVKVLDLRDQTVRNSLMLSLQKISSARKKLLHKQKEKKDRRSFNENLLKSTPQTLKVTNSIARGEDGMTSSDNNNLIVLIESGDLQQQ